MKENISESELLYAHHHEEIPVLLQNLFSLYENILQFSNVLHLLLICLLHHHLVNRSLLHTAHHKGLHYQLYLYPDSSDFCSFAIFCNCYFSYKSSRIVWISAFFFTFPELSITDRFLVSCIFR